MLKNERILYFVHFSWSHSQNLSMAIIMKKRMPTIMATPMTLVEKEKEVFGRDVFVQFSTLRSDEGLPPSYF